MFVLRKQAPGKVNLYLHITGRRADGYHLLDSLVAFSGVADRLEAAPSKRLEMTITGPFAGKIEAGDNSVLRAAQVLRAYAGESASASITLHKHLPVAAGIGGGSADAAAALRLLMRLWNLKLEPGRIASIALELGADVPACFRSSSLYMKGIGEHITAGPPLAELYAVLANPGRPLRTPDVFSAFEGPFSTPARHPAEFASATACVEFLQRARNDLEQPAIRVMPEVAEVIAAVRRQPGCVLARMSGSGATCFGLFMREEEARAAAMTLKAAQDAWWVQATVLN